MTTNQHLKNGDLLVYYAFSFFLKRIDIPKPSDKKIIPVAVRNIEILKPIGM